MSPDDERDLRELARVQICLGRLPASEPSFIRAAIHRRTTCSLCAVAIHDEESNYEVEVAGSRYQFHFLCHAIWSLESHLAQVRYAAGVERP